MLKISGKVDLGPPRLVFLCSVSARSNSATTCRVAELSSAMLNHDGYYDDVEKEFRGFGMVEEWDAEKLDAESVESFQQPPILTKTWYHTGAAVSMDEIFARASSHPLIASSSINSVDAQSLYESSRTLKGMQLRQEVFGDDGSQQALMPYLVTETSYEVSQISSYQSSRPGTYCCVPREVLKTRQEILAGEPHYEHELVLSTNEYNDILKSVNIHYDNLGRWLQTQADRTKQTETIIYLHKNEMTKPVFEIDKAVFVKPLY
jgi:hypothetical protein